MTKKTRLVILGAIGILILAVGAIVFQKSQIKPPALVQPSQIPTTKKVDLASQPEWVQKLEVKLVSGFSPNGLRNFTFTVSGLPAGVVSSVQYVAVYETTNKGSQGAQSTIDLAGASSFSRTIDLGTCSTKSCVRHEGVTSVDLEFDFTTSSEAAVWSKTLPL